MKLKELLNVTYSLQTLKIMDYTDNCKIYFGKVLDFIGEAPEDFLNKTIVDVAVKNKCLNISLG